MKREAHFQDQVVQLAHWYGWLTYHTFDSRRSAPGFPDLVLVRGPELIFAEIKTERGRVRAEQAEWIARLSEVSNELENVISIATAAGANSSLAVDTYIWRPSDFDDINARLSRGRRRAKRAFREAA